MRAFRSLALASIAGIAGMTVIALSATASVAQPPAAPPPAPPPSPTAEPPAPPPDQTPPEQAQPPRPRPNPALLQAVHACDAQAAGQALQRGADPNFSGPDGSAFGFALACPDPGLARLLLGKGLDPKKRNRDGYDPLLAAVKVGRVDVVQLLLKAGADPSTALPDGPLDRRARPGANLRDSALLLAVRDKRTEIAYLLLEAGADPNRAGEGGDTPLYLAIEKKQMDVARLLLDHGADANVRKQGKPVLFEALHDRDMIILLLEHDADLNATDYDSWDKSGSGDSALHVAVTRRDRDLVNYLLAAGCDQSIRNAAGNTALDIAFAQQQAGRGNPEILQMLQDWGKPGG